MWTYHILKIPTGKRGDDKINTKNKLLLKYFLCCYHFLFVFVVVIFLLLYFFCFCSNLDDFHGSERETQSESSALPCKNLEVCLNEGLLTFYVNILSSQYVAIYNRYFDRKATVPSP